MTYYLDGNPIEFEGLIKRAKDDYGYQSDIYQTSVAARILREHGHTVSTIKLPTKEKINSKLLEETLRKDGWTMNATDFILEAVKEKEFKS